MATGLKTQHIVAIAIALTAGVCLLAFNNIADADASMEKCYGIAKAGKNDCDQNVTTCDKSVIDGDPNYYMWVPTGSCDRIVGGMTAIGAGTSPGAGMSNMPMTMPPATPGAATTPAMPGATPATPSSANPMGAAPTPAPMAPTDQSTMPMPPPATTDTSGGYMGAGTTTSTTTTTTGTGMGVTSGQ